MNKTTKLLDDLPPSTVDPCAELKKSLDKWGVSRDNRDKFEFKPINNMDTLKILNDLGNTTSSAHMTG